jgi:hypothetical protein
MSSYVWNTEKSLKNGTGSVFCEPFAMEYELDWAYSVGNKSWSPGILDVTAYRFEGSDPVVLDSGIMYLP